MLRHLRLAACLTQEELAEHAGLSARAVGALEWGINRTPRRHNRATYWYRARPRPEDSSPSRRG
ncbi:MAG TPA: helix-turn-helix transcriptional regulator, partial [Chloroflexota bacterium]